MLIISYYHFSILSGCYDNTVKVWNTEGENLVTIPAHSAPTKCVAWIKNGRFTYMIFTSAYLKMIIILSY